MGIIKRILTFELKSSCRLYLYNQLNTKKLKIPRQNNSKTSLILLIGCKFSFKNGNITKLILHVIIPVAILSTLIVCFIFIDYSEKWRPLKSEEIKPIEMPIENMSLF